MTSDLHSCWSCGFRRSYCSSWCQCATFASSVNGKTESTGVEATAVTKAEIVSLSGAGDVGFTIGNGTNSATITTTTISAISDITALRDAINDKTGTTNITVH